MFLEQLLQAAEQNVNRTIAVASAHDAEVIEAVSQAIERNIARFIFFGDQLKIEKLLGDIKPELVDSNQIEIHSVESDQEASVEAVKAVKEGRADVLMKGMLPTSTLLKAVLNSDYGIRTNQLLSHVAVFDIPDFDRPLYISDSGMIITPDINQKVSIIKNVVKTAHLLGNDNPKVALLGAVETVNLKMPATTDAALISKMYDRGEFKGCVIDGPLGFDNAISLKAAKSKQIKSEVAGRADILIVPSIEVGNILYKSLVYFGHAKVGGLVTGAAAPIIVTSRSDNAESKLYSIGLAVTAISRNQ